MGRGEKFLFAGNISVCDFLPFSVGASPHKVNYRKFFAAGRCIKKHGNYVHRERGVRDVKKIQGQYLSEACTRSLASPRSRDKIATTENRPLVLGSQSPQHL